MYELTVDHKNKTITMTKRFEKLTRNFVSDESKTLAKAMRQYPHYKIEIRKIKSNPDKMTYKGLTYDVMKDYFTANKAEQAKYLREKLDEMRGRRAGKRDKTMKQCSYAEIRAWFFAECPEIEERNKDIRDLCENSKKKNLTKNVDVANDNNTTQVSAIIFSNNKMEENLISETA